MASPSRVSSSVLRKRSPAFFGVLFDAPRGVEPERQHVLLPGETVKAAENGQHTVRLVGGILQFVVQFSDITHPDLFCFSAAERRQDEPFKDITIMRGS